MLCAACGVESAAETCGGCGGQTLLDGRYRLDAVLGRGATGTTWRAVRLGDGRAVAAKEVLLHGLSEKAAALVAREARVLRELSHPGIPAWIEDFETGRGRARARWIVQELVDGETLGGRLDVGAALDVLERLLPVLAYLHERTPPVVHRDLKPRNVLRREGGALVLVDFGAVRDALASEGGGSTVAGTLGYMAPESVRGEATPATDLYGAGALALALLAGREAHDLLDARNRLSWRGELPAPLVALLDALLHPDPALRPGSAREALGWVRRVRLALEEVGDEPARVARPPRPLPVDGPPAPRPVAFAEREPAWEPEIPELPARPSAASAAPWSSAAAWSSSAAQMAAGGLFALLVLVVVSVGAGGAVFAWRSGSPPARPDVVRPAPTPLPERVVPPPAERIAPPPGAPSAVDGSGILSDVELRLETDPAVQRCLSEGRVDKVTGSLLFGTDGARSFGGDLVGRTPDAVVLCVALAVEAAPIPPFVLPAPAARLTIIDALGEPGVGLRRLREKDTGRPPGTLRLEMPAAPGEAVVVKGSSGLWRWDGGGVADFGAVPDGYYRTVIGPPGLELPKVKVEGGKDCAFQWTGARWDGGCG